MMSGMKFNNTESDLLLLDAINNWRPDRPRRWLSKYGSWHAKGYGRLAVQYRAIKYEAERLVRRQQAPTANGLPSHTAHIDSL